MASNYNYDQQLPSSAGCKWHLYILLLWVSIISVCKAMVKTPFATPARCVIDSYMYSHVFVEPAEHVCPSLPDAGFVCGVDVLSLAVDKPMSLTRKDLHLVIHCALLLQLCFENTHLRSKMMQAQIAAFESAISAFILTKKMFQCWCI